MIKHQNLEDPFSESHSFYLLVEIASTNDSESESQETDLLNLFEHTSEFAVDGVIAMDEKQHR